MTSRLRCTTSEPISLMLNRRSASRPGRQATKVVPQEVRTGLVPSEPPKATAKRDVEQRSRNAA